ncbi:Holliday junction resolvase RuvX [Intrasporangium calvum]|uniref:Putative pre-16S rRNA nuclease n=1 Tax=Intrasporangium calvum (strain ATCC 23552 / DSM 43043 / JCM 3097 / NBRC 12989 / NCIMB 10167 / NRRL B-3866 / 7 KIP) TaxID=710696 RepID=E6S8W4_INTC7|nr:Holliday junction resolvase RuvX [Intrasporangium calvum]ADU48101.1 Holliday junction resolvase YqgF [Intrasporangium calvum DSM 43043]AXG13175.1 Holliday junction resolvase RuvX [Intrasporangium calvum]
MSPRPGVRLGIDVGDARVGVAASDPSGTFANPVQTLARDVRELADIEAIAILTAERDVLEIVVGLPRLLSGGEGEAARGARAYAAQLAARVAPVPVRLVDERLTTVGAHQRLRDSGVPGRGQRSVVDQAAAVLILQSALDAEASAGTPAGEVISLGKPRKKERRR